MAKSPKIQDTGIAIPKHTIPQMKHRGNDSSRKTLQDVGRKIPIYPDLVKQLHPKPVKTPIPEIPGSLLDIGPELNTDFEDNSPFQEGVISQMYQRQDKSYFQEPQEWGSLINTGKLVQKFLLKQADIDKILKIIQRKVLKGMHLPLTVKEIQTGYLITNILRTYFCTYLKINCLVQRPQFEKWRC